MAAHKTTTQDVIKEIRAKVQSVEMDLAVLEDLLKPPMPERTPDEASQAWQQRPASPEQLGYIAYLGGDPSKVKTSGEADEYIKRLRRRV